jgi:RNA polymerase sigma factor (sigma-70 family)
MPPQAPIPPESRDVPARAAERLAARDLFNEALSYALQTLRRLGVAESDRDELAQEIVIAAFLKRRDYDPGQGSPRQWLHGFTVKFVCNYRRTRGKMRGRLTELPLDLPAGTLEPGSRLMAEQLRELLHNELFPQLPFEVLTVVVAREFDDLEFATIAKQQQIPISTVHDRYTRGMVALRSAYKRHQRSQQAQGLAVLPFSLEQLLDADRAIPPAPPELVRDTWSRLQRARESPAPWRAWQSILRRPATHLAATFLAGGVFGAVLHAALQPVPRPVPVVVQQGLDQHDPDLAPRDMLAAAALEEPLSPTAVLPAPLVGSAPGRDLNEEQREFDRAHQAFDRGQLDAALAALAAYERRYPAGAFAAEREILRARITQLRTEVPPRP